MRPMFHQSPCIPNLLQDGCLKLWPPGKGIKLCDVCHKTLQDIYIFKQRALHSLNQLKKQWEFSFNKRNLIAQNRPQPLPEDTLIITTVKTEIKEEPDPLDTPVLTVLSHTTPEANVSELEQVNIKEANDSELEAVDIKEEIHIDNDQWNTEDNSDTVSADSEDMVDEIKKITQKTVRVQSDVKRVDEGPKYRNSSAIIAKGNSSKNFEVERKIIAKKNIKSSGIQNAAMPLALTASKPESSLRVTSDSSYMPVKFEELPCSKVEHSALFKAMPQRPVPTSHAKVRTETPKDQYDTEMPRETCPDTGSGFEESKRIRHQLYKIPWYITVLTREQLVKIREDLLKDPSFAEAAYKCVNCGQTFNTKEHWGKHRRRCSGGRKRNGFPCFVCGLKFETLSRLSLHMRFHSLGHHTYQCSTCDYTTEDMYFVYRHLCPNKGGEKVPPKDPTMKLAVSRRLFYCPACDYVSHKVINSHYIRYHTNKGPVECDLLVEGKPPAEKKEVMFCAPCLKTFYKMATYRAHMKSAKHAAKDQLNISCDECPRKFHLQELYERHKRSHELVRSGAKPHKCPHCGLCYVFKRTLSTHIREKHTKREIKRDYRDHNCDVCGAVFTCASLLRYHMIKHSDERPYKCEYCGKTFKYTSAWYTHIKLKHKKKKTIPDETIPDETIPDETKPKLKHKRKKTQTRRRK